MQSNAITTGLVVGNRFHNLVASRILIPYAHYDDAGEHHCGYKPSENKDAVEYLTILRNAVKCIAHSNAPVCKEWWLGKQRRYSTSVDGKMLWHAIRNIGEVPKAWGREDQMNPYLSVGVRLARKWYLRLRFYTSLNNNLAMDEEYPRRMMRHIVYVIRRVCTSKKFVARVKQLKRQRDDNYAACCEYFLSILRVHARPLILRVDCYITAEAKTAADEGKIERAVEKLIRNLRERRIIPDVLGYIVKREDAYDRGIHLHLMVIVDGDNHFQTYNLTEKLKMYWIHECVGSTIFADGFNCYLRKDEYRCLGMGHVHYADEAKMMGVREIIEYLTKTDDHFTVPKSFGKNMRKGQSPKGLKEGKRRGAPRKYANNVSLAERILLGNRPMRGWRAIARRNDG